MSKNLQKILAGSLATLSSLSVVTPVMAATVDVDALYKNAYDAMRKAQETEKQSDINAAMDLIWQLRHIGDERHDENLITSACTWSSLVDQVQHPKLVKIVDAILKAQETGKQADINAAFATIEPELPDTWRSSYTSAIDLVQQELQQKFIDAVENAESKKTEEAVKVATELKNELLTSTNQAMVNWTNEFGKKLDAIVIGGDNNNNDNQVSGLYISKVPEFTRSGFTVQFPKLSNNLEDITIEVIDNNGKVVEVTANTLLKGQTQAKFSFHEYLDAEPLGTWTVNGIKVNLTERKFVGEINSLNTSNSDREFGHNLKVIFEKEIYKGLVEYKKYNLEAYAKAIKAELNKGNAFTTTQQVQDLINKVNQQVIDANNKADYIKNLNSLVADKDATLEQLGNLLNLGVDLGYISGVNTDWLIDYKAAFRGDVTDISDLQSRINQVKTGLKTDQALYSLRDILKTDNVDKNVVLGALQNSLLDLSNVKAENIDYYYMNRINIAAQIDNGVSLTELNSYIQKLNTIADVVKAANANNLSDMTKALTSFADAYKVKAFPNLTSGQKQDAAEEFLASIQGLEGKESENTIIRTEMDKASATVLDNLGHLNNALSELYGQRELSNFDFYTNGKAYELCDTLEAIVGRTVTLNEADNFYNASINTVKVIGDFKYEELEQYDNYTEVREIFTKANK